MYTLDSNSRTIGSANMTRWMWRYPSTICRKYNIADNVRCESICGRDIFHSCNLTLVLVIVHLAGSGSRAHNYIQLEAVRWTNRINKCIGNNGWKQEKQRKWYIVSCLNIQTGSRSPHSFANTRRPFRIVGMNILEWLPSQLLAIRMYIRETTE